MVLQQTINYMLMDQVSQTEA